MTLDEAFEILTAADNAHRSESNTARAVAVITRQLVTDIKRIADALDSIAVKHGGQG